MPPDVMVDANLRATEAREERLGLIGARAVMRIGLRMIDALWPQYISIYNDAYRPVLGVKNPWARGQPVSGCWSEIWQMTTAADRARPAFRGLALSSRGVLRI